MRSIRPRTFAILLILASTVTLHGCIPIFYAYPTLSRVPALELKNQSEKVYVFGVDKIGGDGNFLYLPWEVEDVRLLAIEDKPFLPSQTTLRWSSGVLVGLFYVHNYQTSVVRLYRPGYQVIELEGALLEDTKLEWKPAASARAQEEAIDKVINCYTFNYEEATPDQTKFQGKASPFQFLGEPRKSKLASRTELAELLANEYERIALLAAWVPAEAQRLKEKAELIRMIGKLSKPRTEDERRYDRPLPIPPKEEAQPPQP